MLSSNFWVDITEYVKCEQWFGLAIWGSLANLNEMLNYFYKIFYFIF